MASLRSSWMAVAWAPYSRMSDTFARELRGKLFCIHYLRFQSPLHAPFKYVLQALRTLQVLMRERPTAVHVQTPPFVCGLVVLLYCRLVGARYVLHYHSAAFASIWGWALPVQRFLARHAATNIVTNEHWAAVVRGWGGHSLVMVDPFLDLPEGVSFPVRPGFNLAFVSTFAPDEPTAAVLQAATLLPEVNFYITGNLQKLRAELRAQAPPNVIFTGFLDPYREYPGLLRAADAIMVLTTRDHTLQLGGCEAIAVGKPLITSDWPYLRQVFAGGAVYVADSAESIREGILALRQHYEELQRETLALRATRRHEWDARLRQLEGRVARV